MVSMQKRPTDWSPIKALGTASQYVDSLMVPGLSVNLEDREHLEFSDLMNASNRDLSEFLVAYGGYKAFLESQIADAQAKKNAWTLLINDPALGGKAQRLDWLHDMQVLSDKARRGGFFERAESIDNRIQKIEAMPIK